MNLKECIEILKRQERYQWPENSSGFLYAIKILERLETKEKNCEWEINLDGYWESDCNEKLWLDITNLENIKYCCFCGKPAKLKEWEEVN